MTTKFKQLNNYYFRCLVTNLLYIKVSESETSRKLRCVSKLNKDALCTKYKKDII